jgi:DNA mismatch repair protein MutS2
MKNRLFEFKELTKIKTKLEATSNKYCLTFLDLIYNLIINEKILINLKDTAWEFYLFLKENPNFSININEAGIFNNFFITNNLNIENNNYYEYTKYIDFNKLEFYIKPKYSIFGIDSLVNFFNFLKDFLDVKKRIKSKLEKNNNLSNFNNFIKSSDFNELYYILDNSIDVRGYIKDTATSKLKEIRNEIKNLNNIIPLKLKEFIEENQKYLNSKDITIRNNRYVILLNNQYINLMEGIIQDYSSTHKTAFFEPNFIIPYNNRLTLLNSLEQEEIQKILITIYDYITKNLNNLNKVVKIISVLSFLENYYKLSPFFTKCNTESNKSIEIQIKSLINPIIKNCVEVDFKLNKKALLITGVNASGKTTLMKSIVLISIFNNLDLPVFAKYCKLPKFDKIFFEFTDFQDLEFNLSTFSSHVSFWNEIINYLETKAKEETVLIILDEGVSGTNPLQAAALTIALIEELLKYDNTYIIFSTHYDEVKEYVLKNNQHIAYASINFDYQTLQSKYKLIYDTFSDSLGIEIANKLGLKNTIIQNSYNILKELDKSDKLNIFNDYIKKINEYNTLINNLKQKELELDQKLKELKKIKENIIRETFKTAYEKAYSEAKKLFNSEVKNLLNTWEKELISLKSKNKIDKIQNLIKSIKNYNLDSLKTQDLTENITLENKNNIEIGDIVFINSLNLEGEVIDISKNKVLVKSENITYEINKNNLKLIKKSTKTPNKIDPIESKIQNKINYNPKNNYEEYTIYEINIRGDSYIEAKKKVEDFIKTAFLIKLKTIRIIHGKGQVLSKMVWDYLKELKKKNLMVKDFYFANEREGSFGVTIVELLN